MKIHTVELWPGAPELHEVVLHSEHTQALARVEAERDEAHEMRRIELSKRLAEEMKHEVTGAHLDDAIGLLQFAYDHAEQHRPGSMPNEQKVRAFLARHAQAEQQEAQDAQPSEFQREDRYIVIKRKDLEKAPALMAHALRIALDGLREHLPERECLVVESDWPEYKPAWSAIQARVTGQGEQAVDDARKAAFENHWYAQKATAFSSTEAQRHFDAGWKARADLATQPAAQDDGSRAAGPTHPYREEC